MKVRNPLDIGKDIAEIYVFPRYVESEEIGFEKTYYPKVP